MQTISKIIGWALVAYGASAPLLSKFLSIETTPQWWIQVILTIIGGFSVILLSKFDFAKLKISEHFNKLNAQTPKAILPKNSTDYIPELSQEEFLDMRFLHYLAERFADDKEALELCSKLNDKIFAKHHSKVTNHSSTVI